MKLFLLVLKIKILTQSIKYITNFLKIRYKKISEHIYKYKQVILKNTQ